MKTKENKCSAKKYGCKDNATAIGHFYITVFQRGRLGNQMFQYAAQFSTAYKNKA